VIKLIAFLFFIRRRRYALKKKILKTGKPVVFVVSPACRSKFDEKIRIFAKSFTWAQYKKGLGEVRDKPSFSGLLNLDLAYLLTL
jgi:hypothetical protein